MVASSPIHVATWHHSSIVSFSLFIHGVSHYHTYPWCLHYSFMDGANGIAHQWCPMALLIHGAIITFLSMLAHGITHPCCHMGITYPWCLRHSSMVSHGSTDKLLASVCTGRIRSFCTVLLVLWLHKASFSACVSRKPLCYQLKTKFFTYNCTSSKIKFVRWCLQAKKPSYPLFFQKVHQIQLLAPSFKGEPIKDLIDHLI
ncbi:hypothetical protein DUNSADRAFT_12767 [Dunaliella salina]|uniref:Uncharacterized protein n=1 Tax=Dunaliella salina TaxID=3046 RepID=A0ABQ7GAM6_DUNSA|nr:hypothetical protein DUNSADRAFT_12767 [Dunaliella salina]|eukprot:KAF5831663.1 hypothetical protein DUNSADRAFT_12767 [Dunaliella salina]